MLTVSRALFNTEVASVPDPIAPWTLDFVELVSLCLKQGWTFTHEPTELYFAAAVRRGKALSLLERRWQDILGPYHQVLHLVRGYREFAALSYDRPILTVGGWTAWLDERSNPLDCPRVRRLEVN